MTIVEWGQLCELNLMTFLSLHYFMYWLKRDLLLEMGDKLSSRIFSLIRFVCIYINNCVPKITIINSKGLKRETLTCNEVNQAIASYHSLGWFIFISHRWFTVKTLFCLVKGISDLEGISSTSPLKFEI